MHKHLSALLCVGLAIALAGCQPTSAGTAAADIRYRVFEIPHDAIDPIDAFADAAPIEDSEYRVTSLSAEDLAILLDAIPSDDRLYVDGVRTVGWWPRVASSWSYSQFEGPLIRSGGGAGFLGVRSQRAGAREIRIEFDVSHQVSWTFPHLRSELYFEGAIRESEAVVFFRPFMTDDNAELVHIITFESINWR